MSFRLNNLGPILSIRPLALFWQQSQPFTADGKSHTVAYYANALYMVQYIQICNKKVDQPCTYTPNSDSDECVESFNGQLHMGANTGSTEYTSHLTAIIYVYHLQLEPHIHIMTSAYIWMGGL